MRDVYHRQKPHLDRQRLPRILGLTASPVKKNKDARMAIE
jgi:hypothetical protein